MIPFHKAHIDEEDIESVTQTLRSGWLTMGPKTIEFEDQFKSYINCKYAISLNSATAGLHLALKAIGIKPGDEVIIPAMTFISTAEVVTYFQAIPVLCDIEKDTHNIDTEKIESLITSRTKAIIPVHFAGLPCDMNKIEYISKKYKLYIIEDAAHALPSQYNNKIIGSISDITVFSFYATKTLTTGDGGMVCTSNKEFEEKIKMNRLHGMSRDAWRRYENSSKWEYDILDNGYKYNMTDISASLGLTQLKKLNILRTMRLEIAKRYLEAFKDYELETITQKKEVKTAWHLFVIKVIDRDGLIKKLEKEKIGYSVHFIPIYIHTYYKNRYNYKSDHYPVTEHVFKRSLSLPIWPGLEMSDQQKIIDVICSHVKAKKNKENKDQNVNNSIGYAKH